MPTLHLLLEILTVTLGPLVFFGFARQTGPGFWEENTHPVWLKDWTSRDRQLPGGAMVDPTAFPKADQTTLTADATAAAGATAIQLAAAIPEDDRGADILIPSGTLLDFGTNVVTLSQDAQTGDTALQVEAISAGGVNAGDDAVYAGDGPIFVPPGTVVGRTRAEAEASQGFGPVDFTAGTSVDDDEVYLTLFPVQDASENPEVELLRPGAATVIVYDLLPNWATLDPVVQQWVHDNFTTTQAADLSDVPT